MVALTKQHFVSINNAYIHTRTHTHVGPLMLLPSSSLSCFCRRAYLGPGVEGFSRQSSREPDLLFAHLCLDLGDRVWGEVAVSQGRSPPVGVFRPKSLWSSSSRRSFPGLDAALAR